MNTATQLTTKNNAWLTVGKATWVAFWFLVALAVKASIILLAIVGKLFVLLLAGIFGGDRTEIEADYDARSRERDERQAVGVDDYEMYK